MLSSPNHLIAEVQDEDASGTSSSRRMPLSSRSSSVASCERMPLVSIFADDCCHRSGVNAKILCHDNIRSTSSSSWSTEKSAVGGSTADEDVFAASMMSQMNSPSLTGKDSAFDVHLQESTRIPDQLRADHQSITNETVPHTLDSFDDDDDDEEEDENYSNQTDPLSIRTSALCSPSNSQLVWDARRSRWVSLAFRYSFPSSAFERPSDCKLVFADSSIHCSPGNLNAPKPLKRTRFCRSFAFESFSPNDVMLCPSSDLLTSRSLIEQARRSNSPRRLIKRKPSSSSLRHCYMHATLDLAHTVCHSAQDVDESDEDWDQMESLEHPSSKTDGIDLAVNSMDDPFSFCKWKHMDRQSATTSSFIQANTNANSSSYPVNRRRWWDDDVNVDEFLSSALDYYSSSSDAPDDRLMLVDQKITVTHQPSKLILYRNLWQRPSTSPRRHHLPSSPPPPLFHHDGFNSLLSS